MNCSEALSQISAGGMPITFTNNKISPIHNVFYFAPLDIKGLFYEDSVETSQSNVPFRFGKDLDVDIDINKAGSWIDTDSGRIWTLELFADRAVSINLIFENFFLPEGSSLFLYTLGYEYVLGAFTSANNDIEGIFATAPLPGDRTILEYFEPKGTEQRVSFKISKLIYGYKNIFFPDHKGYGASGFCNINVNCPEGVLWHNEKRSVAMIMLKNNSRICTGALVNNSRLDATPYILTAHHCLGGESTWIFMFNYESYGCTNNNGPLNYTIQGSILRSANTASDFALVEIKSMPPLHYNVYYAGWSAFDSIADSCSVIHHPSGDIKKISFDYDMVSSSSWGSGVPNSHWTVANWEAGTTEKGSSGSPLFNKHKQIIGQLHGGIASCDIIGDDSFGKFSYSWETDPSPAASLKPWLDPVNSGVMALAGSDFNIPANVNDVAFDKILVPKPGGTCNSLFSPALTYRNNGSDSLKSFVYAYSHNNATPVMMTWNGSLPYLTSSSLVIPQTYFNIGSHHLKFYVVSVNGMLDENNTNDTLDIYFDVITGSQIHLTFKTDAFPLETSWELKDSSGAVMYYNPVLSANSTYEHNFCLSYGCYDLLIYDTYGDGMGGSASNPDTGFVFVRADGVLVAEGGGNFGNLLQLKFCVPFTDVFDNYHSSQINAVIYPNPSKSEFNIQLNNQYTGNAVYDIFSVDGRNSGNGVIIFNNGVSMIEAGRLLPGIYYCKIYLQDKTLVVRLVRN